MRVRSKWLGHPWHLPLWAACAFGFISRLWSALGGVGGAWRWRLGLVVCGWVRWREGRAGPPSIPGENRGGPDGSPPQKVASGGACVGKPCSQRGPWGSSAGYPAQHRQARPSPGPQHEMWEKEVMLQNSGRRSECGQGTVSTRGRRASSQGPALRRRSSAPWGGPRGPGWAGRHTGSWAGGRTSVSAAPPPGEEGGPGSSLHLRSPGCSPRLRAEDQVSPSVAV